MSSVGAGRSPCLPSDPSSASWPFALWFARLADYERELSRQVRVLEGLLAICSFCKSIRNERGDWEHLESFISRRSEAEFSHGVCPSCGALHYPDMFGEERSVSNG